MSTEKVVIFDNLVKGHKKALLGGEFVKGDIRDKDKLLEIFKNFDIESVINFAAYIEAGESVKAPLKYYNNNVYGCISLLSVMKEASIRNIVFSSTAAVYGDPENTPIMEDDNKIPINPYGETKCTVEKMLKWSENAYGIKHIILRYFNAAGAHKSGKIGEDHDPETHLIPIVLQNILGKKSNFKIFGDDYDTFDGTCIRDYIHVSDLADAHYKALLKLRETSRSDIYNLGNGKGFSNKQIVEKAIEITGRKLQYEIIGRREGDPAILIASSKKARRELNWTPEYEKIEKIIESAWKWHKENPNGFN